jgi:DNA modification methylase
MPNQQVFSWNELDTLEMFHSDSFDLIICDLRNESIENIIPAEIDAREFRQRILETLAPKIRLGGALYVFIDKDNSHRHIDNVKDCELRSTIVWSEQQDDIGDGHSLIFNYFPILYFTKGEPKAFNFPDPETDYNGDNPGDIWTDIPMLTLDSDELVSTDFIYIQKPEKIIERIVFGCSNPEETVLSVFSDFGTTSIVCKKLNRFSITIENNEDDKGLAINRINSLL